MGNVRMSRLNCINWLDQGPLSPHVDAFKRYLTDRGYARNSFASCMNSIAHFETLLRPIACTGLRISEALALRNEDVDLTRGMLTIHQTKFAKSRHVPMLRSAIKGR